VEGELEVRLRRAVVLACNVGTVTNLVLSITGLACHTRLMGPS